MRVRRGFVAVLAGLVLGAGAPLVPFVSLSPAGASATTSRVSVASDGTQGNSYTFEPSISADGRYVAYHSLASNLVAGDTNATKDVFVHDRTTGTTQRVSVASDGAQGNDESSGASVSADGRYVAFTSYASNLVAGDTTGRKVLVHDRTTGSTERVSVASDGARGNGSEASISADGRYVAFTSDASNLVAGDTNAHDDIFVRDRTAGTTERVSVASNGAQGNDISYSPSISADGGAVAFISWATNLVADDTDEPNGVNRSDVFVRDRTAGTTERVSVASDGTQGNEESFHDPTISADGRYVAFGSNAENLVAGDTNGRLDLFVRDRTADTTERVSVASDGSQANDNLYGSYDPPGISADGRYVVFGSRATNLVAGDTNASPDVFLHNRAAGTTTRLSVDSDGTQGNNESSKVSMSGDGGYVAFHSAATNLVAGDTNASYDVFVASIAAPGAPVILSSTHPDENTWYTANVPSFSWTASDTLGISGYSHVLDQAAATIPDDTSEGAATTWTSPTARADGTWWFHVKARNGAGVWGDPDHYQIEIDSTPPAAPTITASSHPRYLCTSNPTVTMNWTAGSDATSGVLGYSWVFNSDPAATPNNTVETTDLSATWTVPINADGTYWFHVATVDRAGNTNTTDQVYGPICIDGMAEPVTLSPTLSSDMVAQSDQVGTEPFAPSQLLRA
jgi:hypothetical protein